MLLLLDWLSVKPAMPVGDVIPVGETALTGLEFALFSWFMLGAGPFVVFLPTKLSKSMLIFPASLSHVEPIGIDFLVGSGSALLFVELLLDEVDDGRRILSAENKCEMELKFNC